MKPTRQTSRLKVPASFAIVLLASLLSACGSFPQQNDPGHEYPGNEPSSARVAGVVEYVDAASRELGITTFRDYGVTPGQRVGLHYNDRTSVEFEGNYYRPQDLEPGDRIVAEVDGDSRHLNVRSIIVTENSSSGNAYDPDDWHDELHISGTLQKIDKRNKRLIIDTDRRGGEMKVHFNKKTRVLVGHRDIEISELREYDRLNIVLASGKRKVLAETIIVVGDLNSSDYDDDIRTARGQVLSVDENRRELVIAMQGRYPQSANSEGTSKPRTSFDKNKQDRATFLYERGIIVEYQGEYYSPSNLERGDTVEVDYEHIGDDLQAKRILVISSVSE